MKFGQGVMLRILVFALLIVGSVGASADDLVRIDPSQRSLPFEGWGVSLAWWAKVVGNFPDVYRNDYIEKIFDPEKGLGLTVVRYNIGGGENPTLHMLPFRADMEGFEPAPGHWNWSADAGQRWVLRQAKAHGATLFEAFANSPPYWMTVSGSVSGARCSWRVAGSCAWAVIAPDRLNNLARTHEDDFAQYLATVVAHIERQDGIVFRTLEPLNEPSSIWWWYGHNQEGCHVDRQAQSRLVLDTSRALASLGLTTTVSASDENDIDEALATFRSFDHDARSSLSQVNTHSYNGSKRKALADSVAAAGKRLWQSEYGDGDPTGMTLSETILADLRQMHPAAWIYWQAVDGPEWGLLTNTMDGKPSPPQRGRKYWVMANYSRFIRPGAIFLETDDERSLAALNAKDGRLIVVSTNASSHTRHVRYDLSRLSPAGTSVTAFRTSATESLAPVSGLVLSNGILTASLPEDSVTTFVIAGAGVADAHKSEPDTALHQ
ncbi:glycoside hydrolase family 30 protein [Dyella humicola]|uniref:glycoside hydrolase family 30 protein n=1 Tax=Dyella humicola TaxID=2992126 RepID=UPI002256DBDF|nr:glycoside hydrolase [Dyella humicola]